jgi:hypothetical protein
MKWGMVALVLLLVAYNASGPPPLNTNPPAYIKSLAVYREGYDGLVIYFVLADASGQPTTSSGPVHLVILDKRGTVDPLYLDYKRISAAEFRRTTVGRGPYTQETLMYSFGRIPYSAFRRTAESPDVNVELSVYVSGQTYQAREHVRLQ